MKRINWLLPICGMIILAKIGDAQEPGLYARGTGGAAVSAAPEATQAALDILREGGNAADAAIAAALVLAVVHPQAGNLGGGGFAVAKFGRDIHALDFREVAPAAATPDMYIDENGEPKPDASLIGGLAVGVPGTPAGLAALHEKLGKRPWRSLITPAAKLAIQGFDVSERLHRDLSIHEKTLGQFQETANLWYPDGSAIRAGTRISLPELGGALNQYARFGPRGLSEGKYAEMIVDTCRRYGGIMTLEDLSSYQPKWREPVRFKAWDWEVACMPLPSSGGLILAETTGILSRLDWNRLPAGSPLKYHLMIEAWRQAYADRFHLGDPERLPWNPSDLLDPEWLSKRAASLEKDHAGRSEAVHPYEGAVRAESMETTHLSVADAEGNLVAMTITLNGSFGSGLVVAGGGFFLNNEMDDFATVPGQPNLYGLIQGEENAVGPGRRMLSSMSPTLLWNKDREYAFGSPGGSRIPTTVFQVLAGIVSDGLDLDQAIRRGRIHHQWLPDLVQAEGERLEEDALSDLKKDFGHEIETVESMGEVHGVGWDGTTFEAAADIRGPGSAGVVSDRAGTEMSGNAANGPVFGETMAQ